MAAEAAVSIAGEEFPVLNLAVAPGLASVPQMSREKHFTQQIRLGTPHLLHIPAVTQTQHYYFISFTS